jgi:hypothetical protein
MKDAGRRLTRALDKPKSKLLAWEKVPSPGKFHSTPTSAGRNATDATFKKKAFTEVPQG